MWLHAPLLLLGILLLGVTCTSGLKFPRPLLRGRGDATPPSKPAGQGKLPPKKRPGGGGVTNGKQNSRKASKRGLVRPKVSKAGGLAPERDDTSKVLAVTGETAKSIISGTSEVVTEVMLKTLANTGPGYTLLTPLHKWSSSRKRVAEAVKEAAAADGRRPATASERQRRKQQRALFEQQEESRANPWLELLRDTVSLPQPFENTYNALLSIAAVPGQLAQSGKRTVESVAVAAETVAALPDRVRETVTRTQATVKTAQEVLAEAPGRVEEVVTATRELPGRVERAVEEGAEAVEAVVETGRKAAEAVETFPSWLPDLMANVADDALSVAEGTVTGLDAAGGALWGLTKDVAAWASDLALRQALAPVHEYRTSARRVQAALDEEQVALPQARPQPRSSSAKEAPSTPALLVTAGTTPPGAGDSHTLDEDTTPDVGESMPVSMLAGLRERFSSWRRKRKSILAVAVADGDDDDDSEEPTTASSPSKPTVLQDPLAETASAAVQAEAKATARRSDAGGKPLREDMAVGATAKTPTAENVLVTDGQVAAGGMRLPLAESAESVDGGGAAVSPRARISPASVGAIAVTVTSENRGEFEGAAVPAAACTLEAAGSQNGLKEKSSGQEKPVARVTAADPSDSLDIDESAATLAGDDEPREGEIEVAGERRQSQLASPFTGSSSSGGASPETGERTRADAKLVGETSVSKRAVGTETPFANMVSDDKDALLGVPDVEASTKKGRPLSAGNLNLGASEAAVVAGNAKETVNTPTVSTASESTTAREQVAAEGPAPLESGERFVDSSVSSVSSSSSVPTGTALSLRSPSRHDSSRKERGGGNEKETVQEMLKTHPAKTEEGEGQAKAGRTASVGKPVVGKPAVVPSKVEKGERAAAEEKEAPRVAGETGGFGGGSGAVGGPSSGWNAMNPAAEFSKDWVDKVVPQKKAELKRRETAVYWERQWFPVAIVSDLLQQQQRQRRFQMFDLEYELEPMPREGQRTSREVSGWECQAVADPSDKVPLTESNGLLWAWPDTSSEGLAAAELASPAPLPEFLGAGGLGSAPGVWRRLLRRQTASQGVSGSNNGSDAGGQKAEREDRGTQRYVLCVEQEISCGFSDAVRGLLAASHGRAVLAAAAGANEDDSGPNDGDLLLSSSLAGDNGGSSAEILRAAFDTSSVQGEVLLSSPIVVEWRFSPVPSPAVDGTPATAAQQKAATATTTATKHEPAEAVAYSRRRRWLRRRFSGIGGGGRGGGDDVDRSSRMPTSAAEREHRDRMPVDGGVRKGGAAHYVASLLPLGPTRTKVFARLQVEPSRVLDGRSLWWSRRVRRALLVAALDNVAGGRSAATAVGSGSPLLSSAAEAWLEGVAEGGPVL